MNSYQIRLLLLNNSNLPHNYIKESGFRNHIKKIKYTSKNCTFYYEIPS